MSKFQTWAKATATPNRRCKVCLLPPDLLAEVGQAIADGYGSSIIRKFLAANDHPEVTVSSLENHRRGGHA